MPDSIVSSGQVILAKRSRYRNTRIYLNDRVTFFGTWRPPRIVQLRPPVIHVVTNDERRRPDLVSYRVYRDPTLFWAIGIANGLYLALKDMTPGQRLICPHIDDIVAALQNSSPQA